MRAVVLLIMAVQLVAYPLVAAAEVPPAPQHTQHIGDVEEGCRPFHDELTCLTCRVLSNQPIGSMAAPALTALPQPVKHVEPVLDDGALDAPHLSTLRARAPPRA